MKYIVQCYGDEDERLVPYQNFFTEVRKKWLENSSNDIEQFQTIKIEMLKKYHGKTDANYRTILFENEEDYIKFLIRYS